MQVTTATLDAVREYYGKVLQNRKDLKTNACCTLGAQPRYIREVLAEIDDEILDRFYGCGSPIPLALEGCTVVTCMPRLFCTLRENTHGMSVKGL